MNKNKLLLVLAVIVIVAALSLREGFEDGKQLYGPAFTGMASSGGKDHLVSPNVKDIVYPVLFGPQPKMMAPEPAPAPPAPPAPKPHTEPKKKKEENPKITLPSSASLGSDEKSKFLPTSRVPGDMDLIPDPYRVNSSFSTSNYTSKTEPVPFLTDFSAFMK
jgi:hypothetical protein